MRILFVKHSLAWPRSSGPDVHGPSMMRALGELGHEISLATAAMPPPEALAGLRLRRQLLLDEGSNHNGAHPVRLSRMQERYRSYWGVPPSRIAAVGKFAQECEADAVVVIGLEALPYLGAVDGPQRVWYAADEWALHHLTQFQLTEPRTWSEVRTAAIKGVYERVYRPLVDRVWVVSETDRRAMSWVAGVRGVDVVPNGVDADHFRPLHVSQTPRSCVFWGRLDFGPNIQALQWFCRRVWPAVRREAPDARFTIYGFQPGPEVTELARGEGIDLVPDLPDLRPEIARHQIVVLPFVSGGGIKNKLLEAAALGKAIVCTPLACRGLRAAEHLPVVQAAAPRDWLRAILSLWSDDAHRDRIGRGARQWVVDNHTWAAAARTALAGLGGIHAEEPAR